MAVNNRAPSAILVVLLLLGATQSIFSLGGSEPAPPPRHRVLLVTHEPAIEARMIAEGVDRAIAEREEVDLREIASPANLDELRDAMANRDIVVCGPVAASSRCLELSDEMPETRFLLFGLYVPDRDNVVSVLLNRREHGFLLGYALALLTGSAHEAANDERRAALIYDTEPSHFSGVGEAAYRLGFQSVEPRGELFIRSTMDRSTQELVEELRLRAVDVAVLYPPASGEPKSELHSMLSEAGISIVSPYDGAFAVQSELLLTAHFGLADAAAKQLEQLLDNESASSEAVILDVTTGHIGLVRNGEGYQSRIGAAVRTELNTLLERLSSGDLRLPFPGISRRQ